MFQKLSEQEERIWIISEGRYVDVDLSQLVQGKINGPIKEYLISDIGQYLLGQEPIEVDKRLVGCEVHFLPTASEKWRTRLRRGLPGRLKQIIRIKERPPEFIEAPHHGTDYEPKDPRLREHIERIRESIRPCHPIIKELGALDPCLVEEIIGVCQDLDGNRSCINIAGKPADQIAYVIDNIGKPVRVVLEKAHIAEGLFELKGFDFTGYDPENTHRLLKFLQEWTPRVCMISSDFSLCWIDDLKLIQYLQLFEQSIQNNIKLRECLYRCIQGQATPMKLFFNNQLEIDYTQANLPNIFKEIFDSHNLGEREKATLVNHLNQLQIGVAFNYIPGVRGGENIHSEISVMQDMRALEPIREALPLLYSETARRASPSEGGRFYLLDAIRGIRR